MKLGQRQEMNIEATSTGSVGLDVALGVGGIPKGRIIEILRETKCMNPIIYIDELDKVSGTEQGKEIIGILTHLIDRDLNC